MTTLKVNENEVLQLLRTNPQGVSVSFTKKDGTTREMLCTLAESAIPSDKQPKTKTEASDTIGSACAVFDIQKGEWRSFRWESVTSVGI